MIISINKYKLKYLRWLSLLFVSIFYVTGCVVHSSLPSNDGYQDDNVKVVSEQDNQGIGGTGIITQDSYEKSRTSVAVHDDDNDGIGGTGVIVETDECRRLRLQNKKNDLQEICDNQPGLDELNRPELVDKPELDIPGSIDKPQIVIEIPEIELDQPELVIETPEIEQPELVIETPEIEQPDFDTDIGGGTEIGPALPPTPHEVPTHPSN